MGVNYYDTARIEGISPLEAAKLYIDKAFEAGIDCAKFQSYKAGKIASKYSPAYWDTSKETTKSQYELFLKYDGFGEDEYRELCDYTHSKGIDFTSTPFDYESADYLEDMVDFYKISSSDISNIPFVKHVASKGKPVYISTGASYLSEVEEIVRVIKDAGCRDIALLHCVLSYPTKPEDANLSVIQTLKRVFPEVRIGFSDHIAPDSSMIALTTAYLLGAEIIEKHFTLDKSLEGNDHYHAGDPEDFRKAIAGFSFIQKIIGSPDKTVLECEQIPRSEARRSLVAVRDIRVGEVIGEKDVVAKRPGTGISPKDIDVVIGRVAKKEIPEDTIIEWGMI